MGATVLSTNIQVSNDKQWIHIQSTDSFHIEFLGRSKLHLQSSNSSLFHTATSDNDLCFRAFHQVAIVQKYQGSKGRVGWIASVMETWIVMDSVWLPRLPCMTSWQCLKWLLLESDPTWKKIISYSWGTCHRVPKQPDQVEDKQLHLPPRASHRRPQRCVTPCQGPSPAWRLHQGHGVLRQGPRWLPGYP